jgi:tRNA pseudouridine38-40 synthase
MTTVSTRIKLTVAYLGAGFSGWQRQDRVRTVQGDLERAIAAVAGGVRVPVVGAGRTDAGVHAAGQVAHVDLPVAIPPEVLPGLLNARLETDLRVRAACRVSGSFHARKSARGKHYLYRLRWREPELPWHNQRVAVQPPAADPDGLEAACRLLTGRRDWASFTVPEVADRSTVRTVYRVEPHWRSAGVDLSFFGEGFLRYQVRRMVGAVLEIGRGRMTLDHLIGLLRLPEPGAPLQTAEARGLTLERVYYRNSPKLAGS